jgi:alcohol dehydrogenase class IV
MTRPPQQWTHDTLGQRVLFASGGAADALAEEVADAGFGRLMVIAGERELDLAKEVAGGLPVAVWHDEVVMHVPVEVAERARAVATEHRVDAVVSIGGGSTTGLAKAVALTTGLPMLAVPTTYAGSEATNVWGLTEAARKTTGVDPRVLPRTIVYDAALMLTLPVELSVASGLNALAHCVDSMWGPRVDPLDQALAGEGIRALAEGLPRVVADPHNVAGREQTLYGAYLAAVSFASAGSGLHHKICHVLGGMFDLPHAETHAVVLPHVLALNGAHAPQAEDRIAAAFGSNTADSGLAALRTAVDAPVALKDYGMRPDGIAEAVPVILAAVPAGNPAEVTEDNLTTLLRNAYEGNLPA